ncbi:2OG-Fe(II) oxygenase [Aggregicoccus sp. 17bor-14]|uniref:2OG-Fe(II) oxygenase n=1 Tax=Myxococcaceae TaxID=31 RepID=UPI00129C79EF|nr:MULTISPECIES: 2OG-Fe(II) oxygenase [Myxococcaceae]MBF5042440.1 2OG-Fe(II) oxygenase [Simulacricoccus sp. 17bor-14]MRI88211.1 2OG-Fe(II) oxygenase [Aggregicoccus sp. 17bor-14]
MPTFTLSDAEVQALGEQGYFVRPAFLGEAAALRVREAALARAGELAPAGVRRGADRRVEAQTRQDLIAWLETAPGTVLGEAFDAFRQLGDEVSRAAYLGLGRFDVQLALYPGEGARYVRHRDAFPGAAGDNRRLTAILYLNPAWEPAHGGQLRLFTEAGPVDAEPVLDRLVVFLSERLEHEVLPSHAPRLALTAWFYGRAAGGG